MSQTHAETPLTTDVLTRAEEDRRREARNAARRDKRRADQRARIARHAAQELVTWGRWDGDRPCATEQDVIRRANHMYSGYLKTEHITEAEAAAALAQVIGA
ncbi:hypothetical protein GCM10010441_38400 [Kitasatospora paracochleata]|uniref:Membrane protein n=1 Tax=Kitasatospora paracochleata TaxID=58354 RepID=A0ABT1IP67_9ACTN|nr:hypothetical protein [Kitasatospora paracochleata]MCP2306922.1 putative membrane protein [Kitasatospora paracochleata]